MAQMAKKLHFLKNGTEQTALAYSTTAEAGSTYITNVIDGTMCYIPLVNTSDSRATLGRVLKSGTTYAMASTGTIAYTKKTYTSPGTYTFTVPSGVTRLKLTVAGGGGGSGGRISIYGAGGGKNGGYDTVTYSGGSGGRGELITKTVSVSSGTTYSVKVGSAGSNGSSATGGSPHGYATAKSGSAGGSSSVGSLVTARGGGGGHGAWSSCPSSECYTTYRNSHAHLGSNGTSYSGGAAAGNPGWVYIEYGQGIT